MTGVLNNFMNINCLNKKRRKLPKSRMRPITAEQRRAHGVAAFPAIQ